jgi:antitoxin (DNA-binding transcriptional repressor) of toxin-antitoxin stability system
LIEIVHHMRASGLGIGEPLRAERGEAVTHALSATQATYQARIQSQILVSGHPHEVSRRATQYRSESVVRFRTTPVSGPDCARLSRSGIPIPIRHTYHKVLHLLHSGEMNKKISQRELRNDSGAVLREVQAGQIFTITRNGVPVAELRRIPPRRFVPRAAIADARGRAGRIDARRFRADLDAVVDQSIDG